jgi:predicted  nucleic acid-binding Zn-ribbon protein
MTHCANCEAVFETDDSPAGTTCPRCGAVAAVHRPNVVAQPAPGAPATPNHGGADFWFDDGPSKGGFALSGRPGILRWTKNVAVRLTSAACPRCGRKLARGSAACPSCGQVLRKDAAAASSDFGAAIKKMLLAATLFIGLPAAVIVFVLVVCAPEGADVAKAPKGRPAAAQGAAAPVAQPEVARPQRRTPLSVLRSLRDKLRGTEHDGGSVPAKPSLEKTSDGPTNTNVPAVGTGNGNQVKPDAPR